MAFGFPTLSLEVLDFVDFDATTFRDKRPVVMKGLVLRDADNGAVTRLA